MNQHAVVWGASGGIGRALVARLAVSGDYAAVHAGSRTAIDGLPAGVVSFRFDLRDENSIAVASATIARAAPVDLAIVATGMLQDGTGHRPEKSFAELSPEAMIEAFRINTIGPALIAKHMIQALPRDRRCVLAALSARVGSICDNRLGGWHSYRASKAALNMIIANLAIELRRTRPQAIALGLHPGTTDTRLSAPFRRGVPAGKLFRPEVSAAHLLTVMQAATSTDSGSVLDWNGQRIPW